MLMGKKTLDIRYDWLLSNFLILYFLVQAMNLYEKLILDDAVPHWNLMSKGVLAILLVGALIPILGELGILAVLAEMILVVLFSYTLVRGFEDRNGSFASLAVNTVTVFLPMGLAAAAISDKEYLLRRMYRFSWPTRIILWAVLYLYSTRTSDYSMVGGYALLLQTLLVLDHYEHTRTPLDLLAFIGDVIMMLLFGSRGPLLCILAYIVIRSFYSGRPGDRKKILIFVTLLATIFYMLKLPAVQQLLIDTLNRLGIYSRSISMFLSESAGRDDGRIVLFRYYLENAGKHPWLGWGLGGGWINEEDYPHNVVIEIINSFGYAGGVLVLTALGAILLRGASQKNRSERRMAHILLAHCTGLMLSDTFLASATFFMCLGICCSGLIVREKK